MKKLFIFCLIVLFSCEKRGETLPVTLEFTDYISHLKVKNIEVCTTNSTTTPACQQTNSSGLATFERHPLDNVYNEKLVDIYSASKEQYDFPPIVINFRFYIDNIQITAYPKVWFRPLAETSDISGIIYTIRGKVDNLFYSGYKILTGLGPFEDELYRADFGRVYPFKYSKIDSVGNKEYLPMDTLIVDYRVNYYDQTSQIFRDTLPAFKGQDTINFTFKTK